MKLCVDFDDALIERYVRRGGNPLFTIYWKQGGAAYPEEQWLDFGSVIIGWWLVAAKSLLDGAVEAEFPFMDGPYRLKAHRFGNVVHFSADKEAWVWRTPIDTLVSELLNAAEKVQQKLSGLGVSDQESLRVGTRSLRTAMSQAKPELVGRSTVTAEHIS